MSQATLSERPYVNSNLFSAHYLDERVQERDEWDCDQVARESMDELQSLYNLEGELVAGYNEDALIDNWIDEVLDELGFGTQVEVTLPDGGGFVDELLFENPTARRDAAKLYLDTEETTDLFERGVGIVEAKQWDADFTVQFSEQRPYRNASHQTKHYLEKTPSNIQWGILTNGRKWRLYGTNDYETQTYYEVDLPELLQQGDLEAFKYFYVFFRPAAFHESSGTTFLDEVWSESETASQELGENLQNNVFTALRVLGRGFVETNDDLDIDPDDDEALDELKEQSLVFLYRLMFVLYAEARGLIHPEGQSAQDEYDQNFSLDELRLDIHDAIGEVDEGFEDKFTNHSTTIWRRLEDLFLLIDQGEEDLGIPPYNGGLFDHEEHDFLTNHAVSNQYLAEVIYRLSTTQNDEGRYVLADYADLDTRHLGSVYEGLLEHQFRIASEQYAAVAEDGGQVWKPATEVSVAGAVETVPENGLYVVNDQGERKATGAYYTPDYVVTYIVEETVGPLVEEIREDLIDQGFEPGTQEYIGPFFRRVTDLRILDPAMGSGHFLTKATGYLSEQVMAEVREAEIEFGVAFDEQHIRREIAKECIYGVDLNGMAVELAKLSMWLETLAADRPLAFLDHHFKQGNSLVGSDIEGIEELESDTNGDSGQASLAEFGATREGTIERLMDIYSEFLDIENETVEDVREMKRKYAEIEQDELRRRLVALANVHTAERFGLDLPSGAYERMAKALEDDEEWSNVKETDWFNSAQVTAGEQDFFHWKLAFPEVFYREGGTTREDAGFDVVIGNPPYVGTRLLTDSQKEYLNTTYQSATGKWDLYCLFTERGMSISSGKLSYIQPIMFLRRDYGRGIRKYIIDKGHVSEIVDLSLFNVFDGATNYVCVFTLDAEGGEDTFPVRVPPSVELISSEQSLERYTIQREELDSDAWPVIPPHVKQILDNIPERFLTLGEATEYLSEGIKTGLNDVFVVDEEQRRELDIERDLVQGFLKGKDIKRYTDPRTSLRCIYPYENNRLVPESRMETEFPNTWEYLNNYKDELENRPSVGPNKKQWYELEREREQELYYSPKILSPDISYHNNFTIDYDGIYFNTKVKGIRLSDSVDYSYEAVLGILNSTLLEFIYRGIAPMKRGDYRAYKPAVLSGLSIPKTIPDDVSERVKERLEYQSKVDSLNLDLLDYLRPYTEDLTLESLGVYQPPEGVSDTKLAATKEDYENLRIGTVTCEREATTTVAIHATARYKPDDEDAYETDQWGYTETEPMPAMRLTDLSETEADLVEAFVPVAVEKADGFAGFREMATKTNSLVDRLEAIVLPDPDDVAADIERYIEAVKRADELDEKIKRTDDLIDEIVYDLYELTEEEIEIVEEAVVDD